MLKLRERLKKGLNVMPENFEDRRRHFRFPAFDDDLGVKLPNENERVLFSNEELLTNDAVDNTVKKKTTTYDREDYQQEELERHRNNLPDYHASSQQRRKSIDNLHQTHEFSATTNRGVKIKRKEATRPSYSRNTARAQQSSYFKPKYVPASIIPDQPIPAFTEEELFASMQKEKDSYLLFDTERASFDVKNDGDPTVQKFHKGAEEVAVTRKQFKKLKKDPSSRQSFSRSMLNTEQETAQTPFEKKQKSEGTRTGILDRSLGSIMEEEAQNMQNSKYFQQD